MLIAGTGDGAYRVTGLTEAADAEVEKVLDVPRVERVRRFDAVDGVFAATQDGLYHSRDGTEWTNLAVPEKTVYAVTVSPTGERIYAGTRPPHVYVSPLPPGGISGPDSLNWCELSGFRELPSRDEWGVPRHDNIAQLRSLCIHPDSPDRIVAGVEPGGVHVSADGGSTWEERRGGVHDDIHEIHVERDGTYIASTGVGLYRTADAGRSWTRLDAGVRQRYFRAAYRHDEVLYTSAACVPPNRWNDPDADPALFEWRGGETLVRVDSPRPDEVVVGWTGVDGAPVGVTHRGTLLRKHTDEWSIVGEIPSPDTLYGRYGNLA